MNLLTLFNFINPFYIVMLLVILFQLTLIKTVFYVKNYCCLTYKYFIYYCFVLILWPHFFFFFLTQNTIFTTFFLTYNILLEYNVFTSVSITFFYIQL